MKTRKAQTEKTRLLILDDHPMMREGLAQLINNEPDLAVCGQAGTGVEGLELVAKLKPDLLLADVSLPDRSGIEVIKDSLTLHPEVPVLVISMYDETLYAERILPAGARGYIMKQEGGQKLMVAIRQVREWDYLRLPLDTSQTITTIAAPATVSCARNRCHAGPGSDERPHLGQYRDSPPHSCPQ